MKRLEPYREWKEPAERLKFPVRGLPRGPAPCSHCRLIYQIRKFQRRSGLERRPEWTESIAVGSESFLRAIKERLGIRAKGRKVAGGESRFELREGFASYLHP